MWLWAYHWCKSFLKLGAGVGMIQKMVVVCKGVVGILAFTRQLIAEETFWEKNCSGCNGLPSLWFGYCPAWQCIPFFLSSLSKMPPFSNLIPPMPCPWLF
jgi:hypothetical protein